MEYCINLSQSDFWLDWMTYTYQAVRGILEITAYLAAILGVSFYATREKSRKEDDLYAAKRDVLNAVIATNYAMTEKGFNKESIAAAGRSSEILFEKIRRYYITLGFKGAINSQQEAWYRFDLDDCMLNAKLFRLAITSYSHYVGRGNEIFAMASMEIEPMFSLELMKFVEANHKKLISKHHLKEDVYVIDMLPLIETLFSETLKDLS